MNFVFIPQIHKWLLNIALSCHFISRIHMRKPFINLALYLILTMHLISIVVPAIKMSESRIIDTLKVLPPASGTGLRNMIDVTYDR